MRALVTGGTGFMGANPVVALAAAGHTPRILRRNSSRLDERLAAQAPWVPLGKWTIQP